MGRGGGDGGGTVLNRFPAGGRTTVDGWPGAFAPLQGAGGHPIPFCGCRVVGVSRPGKSIFGELVQAFHSGLLDRFHRFHRGCAGQRIHLLVLQKGLGQGVSGLLGLVCDAVPRQGEGHPGNGSAVLFDGQLQGALDDAAIFFKLVIPCDGMLFLITHPS